MINLLANLISKIVIQKENFLGKIRPSRMVLLRRWNLPLNNINIMQTILVIKILWINSHQEYNKRIIHKLTKEDLLRKLQVKKKLWFQNLIRNILSRIQQKTTARNHLCFFRLDLTLNNNFSKITLPYKALNKIDLDNNWMQA